METRGSGRRGQDLPGAAGAAVSKPRLELSVEALVAALRVGNMEASGLAGSSSSLASLSRAVSR